MNDADVKGRLQDSLALLLYYEDVKDKEVKASDGSSKQAAATTAPSAEPSKQAAAAPKGKDLDVSTPAVTLCEGMVFSCS